MSDAQMVLRSGFWVLLAALSGLAMGQAPGPKLIPHDGGPAGIFIAPGTLAILVTAVMVAIDVLCIIVALKTKRLWLRITLAVIAIPAALIALAGIIVIAKLWLWY